MGPVCDLLDAKVAKTDAFSEEQLKRPDESAIVLHQGADMPGATDEADKRMACGVICQGSASSSGSTSNSTVTTTSMSTAPATTVTETQSTLASTSAPVPNSEMRGSTRAQRLTCLVSALGYRVARPPRESLRR
ncbi:hypothetical protein EAH80_16355 [Mycobacterium hodleri]|uniref:Uncharacterized protein n=1 Tax=Mycolicibacterium hodleri TaxID=49897 RepID=A0A502E972_9MYCO|nr:hypothetical protein EAH80_16355 [Mycolicibacterium hodleri]